MTKEYLLGIDIGTSACKTALFTKDGKVKAASSGDYPVYYPNPDKPEKILQFLHISSTIKKNVGGCVHVTYR